jgi:hypothetical protein
MLDICEYYKGIYYYFFSRKEKTYMSKKYFIIFALTLLLISACNQNRRDLQEVQYENLGNISTPRTDFKNMTNETTQDQEFHTEPNAENNTETPNQNVPEQTDIDVTDPKKIEQPEIDLGSPSQEAFPLFMTDFQQRWNAISEEQTGDLFIHHFQQLADAKHYQATLKDKITMEVSTVDNQRIDRISIISTSRTNNERLQLLTSWWQVLLITNPNSELNEIDTIFSEMGIGPNSNLVDLQAVSFSFGGLQYKVTPSQQGILFEAIYPNESANQSINGGA